MGLTQFKTFKKVPNTFLLLFMLLILTLLVGCQERPPKSWNSPEMDQLEKKWNAIFDGYSETPTEQQKDRWIELDHERNELLKNSLSNKDICHLAATCDHLPLDTSDRNEFEDRVLRNMIFRLIYLGERERLIELLSRRTPCSCYPYANIEYAITYIGSDMKEPFLILESAYFKSEIPEVRHLLAAAVRRAFVPYEIQGKDDDEFVKNAMKWYRKEKHHLVVNKKYRNNLTSIGDSGLFEDDYKPKKKYLKRPFYEPLFVERE